MKTITKALLLAAAAGLASGCSSVQFQSVGVEPLRNAQGHVIGQKEVLCDCKAGEELARISLYVPRYEEGRLVGYDERVRGGSVLRNLNGKVIGNRFVDYRSRATNQSSRGITVVFVSPTPATSMAQIPSIAELMQLAQLN
jgi:hypothetical protein